MAISKTIGIDMPGDFPTIAYDAVNIRLGPYQPGNPQVWTEYAGGWNAIAFRFATTTAADNRFTASIKHFPQPSFDEYHVQEEALFHFFVTGLAVIESFFYALFALGALRQPTNFPMSTADDLRAIAPVLTKRKFATHFAGTPIEAVLSDLLADPIYKSWCDIRNVLAHRTAPPRHHFMVLTVGGGSGTSQVGSTTWQVTGGRGLVLNDQTTSDKRTWLAAQVARCILATESFVTINFP
jgi:hypothetical protein